MKTKTFLLFAVAVVLFFNSQAQNDEKRFGIELNGGASFATTELAGSELGTGAGYEAIFQYRFMPFTSVYAGWGWNHFNAKESFAGNDMDFEETGYVLGLQFKNQIGTSPFSYFVRAGGLFNHIETENNEGDIVNDTGHGLGWQLAGGIEFDLGKNWSIAPGVKFNSLSRDTDFEDENYQLDYQYISTRVSVIKRF